MDISNVPSKLNPNFINQILSIQLNDWETPNQPSGRFIEIFGLLIWLNSFSEETITLDNISEFISREIVKDEFIQSLQIMIPPAQYSLIESFPSTLNKEINAIKNLLSKT